MNIIPLPKSVEKKLGEFVLDTNNATISCDNLFAPSIERLIKDLKVKGFTLTVAEQGAIKVIVDEKLDKEGYVIEVEEGGITVKASTDKGCFYAVQTLEQLWEIHIVDEVKSLKSPLCTIKDEPRFSWRGFMLDEARHFFGKELVKQTLDMMAMLKFNIFHWHLTDDQGFRVEIKKYPLLTQKGSIRKNTQLNLDGYNQGNELHDDVEYGAGCFYTQEDIKEIVAYAKSLHIDVVPEIDMPGHLVSAIACYPELSCSGKQVDVSTRWGVMDNIGCCGKDDIYNFAKDIIDELVELFPFQYFHIGGDEVPKTQWKTCPKCQAKIKELGLKDEEELQGHFNNVMLAHLKSKNRSMVGWNEILDASTLSNDTIIQWWTNRGAGKAREWINSGNKAIISMCPYVYFDHFYTVKRLSKTYSFDLDKLHIPLDKEPCILGMEAPQWTEYVRDKVKFDYNTYPRMHSIAEASWTRRDRKNFKSFLKRLEYHEEYLKKIGIGSAPRSVYQPKGITYLKRLVVSQKMWRKDPNWELTLKK